MKIIRMIRIINIIKKGLGETDLKKIEKTLYDFYKIKGCLD